MGAYPGHYSSTGGSINIHMYMYMYMYPYGEHECSDLNHYLCDLNPGCMVKESLGEKGTKQICVRTRVHCTCTRPILLYELGMLFTCDD